MNWPGHYFFSEQVHRITRTNWAHKSGCQHHNMPRCCVVHFLSPFVWSSRVCHVTCVNWMVFAPTYFLHSGSISDVFLCMLVLSQCLLWLPVVLCLAGGRGYLLTSLSNHLLPTLYGLEVRKSNPEWGEIFRSRPRRPWVPPSFLCNGYRDRFPGGKAAAAWR
jgi:hypothetical protein